MKHVSESSRALPTPLRTAIAAQRTTTPLPVPPAVEARKEDTVEEEGVDESESESKEEVAQVTASAPVVQVITKLSQVQRRTPTEMRKIKIHALMEALSKDDESGTFDWFNCIVVGKYKKGKGLQIQWTDTDGVTPVGSKEWTTRIRSREEESESTGECEEVKDTAYFSALRVVDLKAELVKLDLSTRGRKADLVERLVAHFA